MTVPTAFTDHLGGVHSSEWDSLARNHLYSNSDWLRFCVEDPGGRTATGAVHVRLTGTGTAAVPVTAIRHENNSFYSWHEQLTERGLPAPGPVGLLAGQRRGYQTRLLTSEGVRPAAAATALWEEMCRLRKQAAHLDLFDRVPADPLPCVGMFLGTEDVLALRGAGVPAMPVALATEAWIPVPQGDWTDWLASLPSKRRAELIRREVRRFTEAGYQIYETTLSECYQQAAELLANTQARYGHAADLGLLAESFRVQGAAMGAAARVVMGARPGEPPVGFCLFYAWGDALYLRAAGFDYDRVTDAAEYFNLVYYQPVRLAIESGRSWVHAGIEAAEAKALRGAELRPLWLLDLAEDSVLADLAGEIRAHNLAELTRLHESSAAVAKAVARDAWLPFC
jgi:uncharacterized protein